MPVIMNLILLLNTKPAWLSSLKSYPNFKLSHSYPRIPTQMGNQLTLEQGLLSVLSFVLSPVYCLNFSSSFPTLALLMCDGRSSWKGREILALRHLLGIRFGSSCVWFGCNHAILASIELKQYFSFPFPLCRLCYFPPALPQPSSVSLARRDAPKYIYFRWLLSAEAAAAGRVYIAWRAFCFRVHLVLHPPAAQRSVSFTFQR